MFDFLKKKTKTFGDLGTDMHCHLLPGVDDGSSNIEETISCLKVLASVGFDKVYFTPHYQAHYPNEEDDIQRRFEGLKRAIEKKGEKDIPELAGISGEYRFDPNFVRRPGVDKVSPLPGKHLLCELSLHANDYSPIDIFKEYIDLGYKLILAHPERYPYLNIHSQATAEMKNMGISFQVNVLSLNGFYGESAKMKGFEYVNNNMSEYLGTDTHNMRYAKALQEAAANNEIKKIMKSHSFLNSQL